MYEILKQYEHIQKRKLSLTELRELLCIEPNEYPRWERFKIRVLDSCQQALTEHTDITFTYEPIRTGHKFTAVTFFIRKPIPIDWEKFAKLYGEWKSKNITGRDFMRRMDLSANTFYRRVHEYQISNSIAEPTSA